MLTRQTCGVAGIVEPRKWRRGQCEGCPPGVAVSKLGLAGPVLWTHSVWRHSPISAACPPVGANYYGGYHMLHGNRDTTAITVGRATGLEPLPLLHGAVLPSRHARAKSPALSRNRPGTINKQARKRSPHRLTPPRHCSRPPPHPLPARIISLGTLAARYLSGAPSARAPNRPETTQRPQPIWKHALKISGEAELHGV